MSQPITDTGDFAEVPNDQRADLDGYDPDDYGGPPAFAVGRADHPDGRAARVGHEG